MERGEWVGRYTRRELKIDSDGVAACRRWVSILSSWPIPLTIDAACSPRPRAVVIEHFFQKPRISSHNFENVIKYFIVFLPLSIRDFFSLQIFVLQKAIFGNIFESFSWQQLAAVACSYGTRAGHKASLYDAGRWQHSFSPGSRTHR